MQKLSNNETGKINVTGSISSIDIVIDTIHETDNTAIDGADLDLKSMYLYIKDLDSNTYVYSGPAKTLALALGTNNWNTADILNELGNVYDTAGVSNPEKRVLAMPIDLHLTGRFEILLKVNSVFGADVDASSKVGFGVNKTTAVAEFTPFFETIDFTSGQTTLDRDLKDGVSGIYLVDYTAHSEETDSYPWSICTFASDLEGQTFDVQELKALSKAYSDYSESANGANFILHEGEILNSVSINLQLQAGNVTAGDQFVVVERNQYVPQKVKMANAMAQRRAMDVRVKALRK